MNKNEIKYWNNFYSTNNTKQECSDFCKFIIDYFENNKEIYSVLDCGCGSGRDTYTFGNKYKVHGIDSCGFIPNSEKNVNFTKQDFITINKDNYDLIYSRFTFHSITDEQQISFLDSINNGYLAIETRSKKGENDNVHHGKGHFRNYTDLNYLKQILTEKNFEILFIKEDKDVAIYKDENPICIRVICKKNTQSL